MNHQPDPTRNRVFRASDGRLYLVGGSNGVANLYTQSGFSAGVNSDSWENLIRDRRKQLEVGDAQFCQLLAPEKLTIHPATLSDRTALFPGYSENEIIAPGRRLLNTISHTGIVYPESYLKEQSATLEVYPCTDSHWTWKGAFSSFQMLMSAFSYRPNYSAFLSLPRLTQRYHGDLWDSTTNDIPEEQMERIQLPSSVRRIYCNPIMGLKESMGLQDESSLHQGSHCIFGNDAAEFSQTVVLFGSAFSEARLAPSLLTAIFAFHFRTVHFIWSPSVDFMYVKRHKADLVVAETPERLLTVCPNDDLSVEEYASAQMNRWSSRTKKIKAAEKEPEISVQPKATSSFEEFLKWDTDTKECCRQIEAQTAELKILLKTKNDSFFLEKWIVHHLAIVGEKNIIVFDNMSDSADVLAVYRKYSYAIIVIRFATFHNLVHQTDCYQELYTSLANACNYFAFLDSDEFLVFVEDDRILRDPRLLQFLGRNSSVDVFPGLWLNNTDWNDSRFACGTTPADLVPKAAWGKPIIRSKAGAQGFLNHNAFLDMSFFRPIVKANFLILHMTNLSVSQRIKANMNKLTARKFGSSADTPEAMIARSRKGIKDFNIHLYIDEIKKLLEIKGQPSSGSDPLRVGCFEILTDGKIQYYSEVEQSLMREFIKDPTQVYKEAIELAAKRDERVHPGVE